MSVTLRPITRDNWSECANLDVSEDQKRYVASDMGSLVKAYVCCSQATSLAVYDGETMVGLAMYVIKADEGTGWICHLMIDKKYQGRGYGTDAMFQIIEHLEANPNCRNGIFTSFKPGNVAAAHIYRKMGFERTGKVEGKEVIMRLKQEESELTWLTASYV